jgi:hypothetical protein
MPEPQWRSVFRLLAEMAPGDILPYATIQAMLGTDDMDRVYRLTARAKRELWEDRGRSITAVPQVGYRMIRANEHGRQARDYERVARRRVADAVVVAGCTHLDELNDAERESIVQLQAGLRLIARVVADSRRRIDGHDELIASLQRGKATVEEVAILRHEVERLTERAS